MDGSERTHGGTIRRPWITRVRFQLLGGLFFAVVIPAVFRSQNHLDFFYRPNELSTIIGSLIAMVSGFVIMRRLSNFPGISAGSYIILSFSMTYGITMAVFFMLRFDYSRYVFTASFALALLWFIAVYFIVKRLVITRFSVISGGHADKLAEIGNIRWTLLRSPEAFDPVNGPVVADLRQNYSPKWERFIADCALRGVPVYHSKQIKESLSGKVEIEHLSENNFGSLLPNMIYLHFKQLADIALALLLFPIFAVVLLVVGTAIFVTSGGPIFFRQKRMGYRGQHFMVYKFRTMRPLNTEPGGDGQQKTTDTNAGSRESAMTRKDDGRITWIGGYLRKYRIDEIPQIINILKGEMSWIGPRPEAVVLSDWYESELPFYRYRHVVRPGISGWAQVKQGHVAEVDQVLEKLHYDFFYIKNLSLWLDFLIALQTLRIVSSGFGAK